ncbi:MAG TPA: alpha/beta fold hydrolase [Chloroflexota bacterium]|nr:alpha/beta fold hydrolase [Chloroflexota bacterium]
MSAPGVRDERLMIAGTRVRVQSAGDGPPLLYLHGAGGVSWLPGHTALAEHCRLIVPEHPNWGEDELADGLESIEDLVYFYLDFLDALDLDRIHLAGHSLGGWLAAEIAVAHPERLWTLTLIDAAGLWLPDCPMPDLFALSAAETARLGNYDPAVGEAAIAAGATPEARAAQVRARAAFARIAWNPYLHNPRLAVRLRRVRLPALVVWGEEDRIIPPAYADEYARLLPDARVVRFPACGHSPARERPAALADAMLAFLRDRAPASARPE